MELLTAVFRQLVSLAVTALPVIAVVLGVRWLLAKLNAPKKYSLVLWCAVWLRLVCPVKWRVRPWSIFNLRPLERVAEYGEAVAAVSSAASAPAVPVVTAPAADISVPAAVAAAAVDWQALAWQGAAVVWLAGLAALLVYGVWSWLRLRRQVSAAVWNGGNVWECDAIPTPFVLGYVHPRVYIPFRLDSNERTYVLAHERYHLRWGDQWWKLLSCLVLAVYWWDAAAWLCWVLFCRDLEMRCDEAVLAQLGDQVKGGYSLSLVSFAMERRFPAALAFGEHDAARRVKHVLAWKKETPRMAFLGVAVVLVVWMVCTSDGETSSWVRVEGSGTTEFTCNLQEPIQSWALYEDVYENGRLLSSEPRIFDGFQENGGATSRRFSGTLAAAVTYAGEGFGGELNCRLTIQDGTEATWTILLPKDHYTGAGAFVGAEGPEDSKRYSLEGNGEVVLYTCLLSTKPDGSVTDYHAEAGVVGANDTVVQFRLVTSTGGTGSFGSQRDLARTLFDLRVEQSADSGAVRALLEAMGAGSLGECEVSSFASGEDTVLYIRFAEGLDDAEETWMGNAAYLLLALATDADRVDYAFPTDSGSSVMTFYCDGEPLGSWAKELGYRDIKDLGTSAQGIRDLMEYLGWEKSADLSLDTLTGQDTLSAFLELLTSGVCGDVPGSVSAAAMADSRCLLLNFHEAPADPDGFDACAAKAAFLLMYVKPEVEEVGWTYPDAGDGRSERKALAAEKWVITSLFSDLEAARTCPVTTQGELDRLLSHAGLDSRAYLAWVRRGPSLTVASAAGDRILAAWYEDGQFDFDYDSLPALTLAGGETLTLAVGGVDTLTAGEDYYTTKNGSGTVERETYTLDQSSDGTFALPIRRRDGTQEERAVYFVPYEQGKFVFQVRLPPDGGQAESTRPFSGILGYDGYIQAESAAGYWEMRTYYAQEGGRTFPIAESFGFDGAEDYTVDLDSDGMPELVANVQFGGDGHQDVYIYQRRGDEVWRGTLDLEDLPNHDNWGANSTAAEYDPAEGVFRVRYAQKGTEEPGVLELRGLEQVTFSKYEPIEA